ncbi:MAG: hypothetical protein HQL71_14200, partial [Magnetococcales bacterium]|nr:hypothetical protein [Magnetococcales bacterium]
LIGSSLGQLSHGDPADRVPFFGGRNEVDAMAGAVNTLADHQERTTAWHAASFRYDCAVLNRDVAAESDPKTIESAQSELQKSRESRHMLLASIRDEINTLMDGILHSVDETSKSDTGTQKRRHIDNIHKNAQDLLDIVEIISGFPDSHKEPPAVESKPFDISVLINTLANFFREYARKKDIHFSIDITTKLPPYITGDAGQLRLILVNLLSNAVKYTQKGEVCLEIETISTHEKHMELLIMVRDTGIGMSTEIIDTMFKPVSQYDTKETGKYRRSGYGLVITGQAIKLLQGSITVESELGKGSTFSVVLPMEIPIL